jgi:hypothetical protein
MLQQFPAGRLWPALAACAVLCAYAPPAAARPTWVVGVMAGLSPPVTHSTTALLAPKTIVETVTTSKTIPLNTVTPLVGYNIYNPATCAQLAVGKWILPSKNPDIDGKWTAFTYFGKQANGACPSKTFTFAGVEFTWTNSKTKAGTVHKSHSTWSAKTPANLYTVKDNFVITLQ